MQKINKLSAGFVVLTIMGTVSVFAMDPMADKMMKDTMATGTMMKDDKMMMKDKGTLMPEVGMMTSDMMMKITKKSKRDEVAKLQQHLIDKGFLKVRAGTKLGYYGPLTTAAYAKYMASMKMEDKMMKDDKMMGTGTDTMMKK